MAKKTISNTFVVTTLIDGEDSLFLELDTYAIAFPTDSDYNVESRQTYTVGARMYLGNSAQRTITSLTARLDVVDGDIDVSDTSPANGVVITLGEATFSHPIGVNVTAVCAEGTRTAKIILTAAPKGSKGDPGDPGDPGIPGARGKIGRFFYFAGTFNSSNTSDRFLVNDAQAPYFEHTVDGKKRYHVFNYETNGSYTMSQMWSISNNSWDNSPWQIMTNDFKYLITEAMFAEYAKLASAIFNGDWMLSQYGKPSRAITTNEKQLVRMFVEVDGQYTVSELSTMLTESGAWIYEEYQEYGYSDEEIDTVAYICIWAMRAMPNCTDEERYNAIQKISETSYELFGTESTNPFSVFSPNIALDFLKGAAYLNKAIGYFMKPQLRIHSENISNYRWTTSSQGVYIYIPQREKSIQIEWVDGTSTEAFVMLPEIMEDEVGVELIITNATESDYNRTSRVYGVTLKIRGGAGDPLGQASTGDPDPNRWLINGIARNTVASPATMGRVVDVPIYHEAHFRAVELPNSNNSVGARAWVCTGIINLSNKTIS